MDKIKLASELVKLARVLVAMGDEEFIADQLVNAWEASNEREMIRHLASETAYSAAELKPLVYKWYGDVRLRTKMERASTTEFERWILSELA